MHDPYATLGVEPDAPLADIRKAWKRVARETHPDRHPGDEDKEQAFKAAAAAWALLSDPARRARYDRERRAPSWTVADDVSAVRAAAMQVRDATEDVSRVLFEAVIPVYVERFDRGHGAELVWNLIRDLDQASLLDLVQQSDRPGFAARQRAGELRSRLRLRLDLRTRFDADGHPQVATLTRVTERGLQWSAITVWVGSLHAQGVTDPDAQRTLLLLSVAREVIRDMEMELPADLRVLAWREREGTKGFPEPLAYARKRDTQQILWVMGRIVLFILAGALVLYALGWAVQGYPPFLY